MARLPAPLILLPSGSFHPKNHRRCLSILACEEEEDYCTLGGLSIGRKGLLTIPNASEEVISAIKSLPCH